MDAGALLRASREAAGLSLRELAERAGTSAATLSMYETGRKEPRLSTVDRVVRAAGAEMQITIAPRLNVSERRSLALHRAVAEHLRHRPAQVRARARANLARLTEVHAGSGEMAYIREWQSLLEGGDDDLVVVLTSTAQHARDLRSASPFAGVLSPRERDEVLHAVSPR